MYILSLYFSELAYFSRVCIFQQSLHVDHYKEIHIHWYSWEIALLTNKVFKLVIVLTNHHHHHCCHGIVILYSLAIVIIVIIIVVFYMYIVPVVRIHIMLLYSCESIIYIAIYIFSLNLRYIYWRNFGKSTCMYLYEKLWWKIIAGLKCLPLDRTIHMFISNQYWLLCVSNYMIFYD